MSSLTNERKENASRSSIVVRSSSGATVCSTTSTIMSDLINSSSEKAFCLFCRSTVRGAAPAHWTERKTRLSSNFPLPTITRRRRKNEYNPNVNFFFSHGTSGEKKCNKVQKRSNPDRDHVWHPREREKKGGLAAAEVSRKMVEGYNARGFRVWLERPSHMSRRPASFHYSSTASPQIRPLSTERQFCSNGRPTLGHTHTHQAEWVLIPPRHLATFWYLFTYFFLFVFVLNP